jgi:CHAT domain-containing protein
MLGLRRGFLKAGARHLLMTLRSVADEETGKIMADFYDAAHRNGDAPRALAEVQRDWLLRLRQERGPLDAVRTTGPFIMCSQGRLQ